MNSSELQKAVGGSKTDFTTARRALVDEALIKQVDGPRGKLTFFPPDLATSPNVAEGGVTSSVDVDAPAYISGAYNDDTELSQIEYLLPKCVDHDYSTITVFERHITLCGDCFDVTQTLPVSGS